MPKTPATNNILDAIFKFEFLPAVHCKNKWNTTLTFDHTHILHFAAATAAPTAAAAPTAPRRRPDFIQDFDAASLSRRFSSSYLSRPSILRDILEAKDKQQSKSKLALLSPIPKY